MLSPLCSVLRGVTAPSSSAGLGLLQGQKEPAPCRRSPCFRRGIQGTYLWPLPEMHWPLRCCSDTESSQPSWLCCSLLNQIQEMGNPNASWKLTSKPGWSPHGHSFSTKWGEAECKKRGGKKMERFMQFFPQGKPKCWADAFINLNDWAKSAKKIPLTDRLVKMGRCWILEICCKGRHYVYLLWLFSIYVICN